MTTKAENTLTTHDIRRGQLAVEEELTQARQAYAAASYDHALDRTNDERRRALIQSKQRVDVLTAELQGLQAAHGEAARRESLGSIEDQVAALETKRRSAVETIDAMTPAFDRTYKAIQELGAAWAALQAAELAANRAEGTIARMPKSDFIYSGSFRMQPIVDDLLFLAIGPEWTLQRSDALADMGGRRQPERAFDHLKKYRERALSQVERGATHTLAELNERAQKLRPAA